MSVNTLIQMTPANIMALIENEKNEAINLAQNDPNFSRKIGIYESTKVPFPDDEERQIYEQLLEDNPNYSIQNIIEQEYVLNGRRNRMIDSMFIDIMNKSIENGIYDNIEIGLSDYARFILYVDDYLHQLGNPAILKEAITNALINRANMFIKQGQEALNPTNNEYDIYEQLPDEKGCKGLDPITNQKIVTGFRLDADERRICYDISTIVKIVNSTFGLTTPVSPFNRAPFSENDMRRIKIFMKNMSSMKPITRSMTQRRAIGGKNKFLNTYSSSRRSKKHKSYNKRYKKSNKRKYRKTNTRR